MGSAVLTAGKPSGRLTDAMGTHNSWFSRVSGHTAPAARGVGTNMTLFKSSVPLLASNSPIPGAHPCCGSPWVAAAARAQSYSLFAHPSSGVEQKLAYSRFFSPFPALVSSLVLGSNLDSDDTKIYLQPGQDVLLQLP